MSKSHRIEHIIIWVVWAVFMSLVSMLFLGQANAQFRNTIFQSCGDNAQTWACDIDTEGTLTDVRNIGQSQHIGVMLLEDGGGTCTAQVVSAVFEGSFTGAAGSYIAFGNSAVATVGSSSPFKATFNAQGTYPFVRANITNFDTTNCQFDFYYSGAITAAVLDPTATSGGLFPTGLIAAAPSFSGAQADTKLRDNGDTCGTTGDWDLSLLGVSGVSQNANVITFKWCDPAGCGSGESFAWGPLHVAAGENWQLNAWGNRWSLSGPGEDFVIETTAAGTVAFNYIVKCAAAF